MAKTTLLLLATGLLLTRVQGQGGAGTPAPTSVAPLLLTGWTPTCSGSTITIPMDARFAGYDARLVTYPTSCSKKDSIDLTRNATIPQDCIDQATMSVVLSFQPKKFNGPYIGGKDHTEAKITCSSLGNDGVAVTASVSFAVLPGTVTPQPFTVAPPLPTVTMALVAGSDINSATTVSVVTLGQNNVYLKINGQDAQQLLLPTKCRAVSQSKTTTYDFFSVETGSNICAYDDEVLGTFSVTTPRVSYAQFYPFMFVSGESVTLTCEVLVCPKTPTGGKCQATDTSVKSCTAGPVPQTSTPTPSPPPAGRRRRSAGESEPDTHVVEVTYTVVGHDPALHGQTAAGAGMAVSIPLLAAVASLWIL